MLAPSALGFFSFIFLGCMPLLGQNAQEFPLSAYSTHSYTPVDVKPGRFGGEIIYLREHESNCGLEQHMNPESPTDFQGLISWVAEALLDVGKFFGFGAELSHEVILYHIPSPLEAIGAIDAFNQLCMSSGRKDLLLSIDFYVGNGKISDDEYIAKLFDEAPACWSNSHGECDDNALMKLPLAAPQEGSSWYIHDLVFHYVGAILLIPQARKRLNTIARIAKAFDAKCAEAGNADEFYQLRTKNFGNAIDLLTGHASSIGRLIVEHVNAESIEKTIYERGTRTRKVTILLAYLGFGDSDVDLILVLGMSGNGLNPISSRDAELWEKSWTRAFVSTSKHSHKIEFPFCSSSTIVFEYWSPLVCHFIRATNEHMNYLTKLINNKE